MLSIASTGLNGLIQKLARGTPGTLSNIGRDGERAGADSYANGLRARVIAATPNGARLAGRIRTEEGAVAAPEGTAKILARLMKGGVRRAGEGGPVLTGLLARQGRVGSIRDAEAGGARRFFGTVNTRFGPRRGVWERGPGGLRALVIFATKGEYERKLAVAGLRETSRAKARDVIRARLRGLRI